MGSSQKASQLKKNLLWCGDWIQHCCLSLAVIVPAMLTNKLEIVEQEPINRQHGSARTFNKQMSCVERLSMLRQRENYRPPESSMKLQRKPLWAVFCPKRFRCHVVTLLSFDVLGTDVGVSTEKTGWGLAKEIKHHSQLQASKGSLSPEPM